MALHNMDPKRCPMPSQDPNVRNKNFKEVALGYTPEMAVNEAKRCLGCKNKPCQTGCPVGIDIPSFIARLQRAARCLRPRLPPGDPVRGQVRSWYQGRERGHRPSGAFRCRLAS